MSYVDVSTIKQYVRDRFFSLTLVDSIDSLKKFIEYADLTERYRLSMFIGKREIKELTKNLEKLGYDPHISHEAGSDSYIFLGRNNLEEIPQVSIFDPKFLDIPKEVKCENQ